MSGTLCTSTNEIGPATKAALNDFAAAGGHVIIATGRGVAAATEVVDRCALSGTIKYCVCMDGGCIVQAPNWEVIWSDGFSGTTVARVLRAIDAAVPGCSFGVLPLGNGHDSDVVSSEAYIDVLRQETDSKLAAEILSRRPRVSENFINEVEATDEMGWIRVLHADGNRDALLQALAPVVEYENSQHDSHVAAGGSVVAGAVILRRATTDKSVALAAMAKQLGFTADKWCVFGDESNDWGMFRWSGKRILSDSAFRS